MNAPVKVTRPHAQSDYLTIYLGEQMFGIPVLQVQDVLGPQNITKIPLARAEITGSLNLRGRIVTAIDVRKFLGIDINGDEGRRPMSVVLEQGGELFSLQIERVGDVISLESDRLEQNPPTMDSRWKDVSTGIYRMEGRLLVILDVVKLIAAISD